MKYKTGLVKKLREETEFKQAQEDIKRRHHIEAEDIVVVEKSNTFKFTVKLFIQLVRLCATASILVLAAIGLISTIYPQIRNELIDVLSGILYQVIGMFV